MSGKRREWGLVFKVQNITLLCVGATLSVHYLHYILITCLCMFLFCLVGPYPHRDRDYCIWSNFWKFYLIRTSFTLGESVSLVKLFRLFKLEQMVFGVQSVDTVDGYLLAAPACLWRLVLRSKGTLPKTYIHIGLMSIVFLSLGFYIFMFGDWWYCVICYSLERECKQLGCGWCGTWVCYPHPHGPGPLMDSVPHFSCEINHPNVYKTKQNKTKFFLTFTWPNWYLLVVYVGQGNNKLFLLPFF